MMCVAKCMMPPNAWLRQCHAAQAGQVKWLEPNMLMLDLCVGLLWQACGSIQH